jgi:hypothetical protein
MRCFCSHGLCHSSRTCASSLCEESCLDGGADDSRELITHGTHCMLITHGTHCMLITHGTHCMLMTHGTHCMLITHGTHCMRRVVLLSAASDCASKLLARALRLH